MSRKRAVGFVVVGVAFASCSPVDVPDSSESLERLTPASVSTTGAWGLFDRSIASGFTPSTEAVRLSLDHGAQISAVKVHGPAPYRLRVRGADGSSIGFQPIDLSRAGVGWNVYPTASLISTDTVELTFESLGPVAAAVPELELWSVDETRAPEAESSDLASYQIAIQPDVRSAELVADNDAASATSTSCASFTFDVARSATTFRRLHLVYIAEGIAGSFALSRTVNGLANHGGAWLAGTGSITVADEIDPALFHTGANEIRLCVPRDATRGVAVSQVRLVADLESGTRWSTRSELRHADAAVSDESAALIDGDSRTTADVRGGDHVLLGFDRLLAPDAIALTGTGLGASVVSAHSCLGKSGDSSSLAIRSQRSYGRGRLVIELAGQASACRSLDIQLGAPATIAEIEVIGSGAAERVDWPHIVIASPSEHFGTHAWLGGYVARPLHMNGAVRLDVAGEPAPSMTGEFGRLLTRDSSVGDAWPVAVRATFPDGTDEVARRVLGVDRRNALVPVAATRDAVLASSSATRAAFGDEGDDVVVRAKHLETTKIRLGTKVGLDIPPGALAQATSITVRHLGETVLPPLDPGMINVTAPRGRGYEFLPHGTKFRRSVEVVMPYDASAIPEGMTTEDVRTYFFDPDHKRWKPLRWTA